MRFDFNIFSEFEKFLKFGKLGKLTYSEDVILETPSFCALKEADVKGEVVER